MSDQKIGLIELVVTTTAIILLLSGFIITILYLYQKRVFAYQRNLEDIKLNHEKQALQMQLEIQEQTLVEVSREIHDNIALSLTLSKLHLNTLDTSKSSALEEKINLCISLIGTAIQNLRNISKGLNADLIRKYGLLKGLENEIENVEKTGLFSINYEVKGNPVFLESRTELVIFRIIQESMNNIVKHSGAKNISIVMEYSQPELLVCVRDDGLGFSTDPEGDPRKPIRGSGLDNIRDRAKIISSRCEIDSVPGQGTAIRLAVPIPRSNVNLNYG